MKEWSEIAGCGELGLHLGPVGNSGHEDVGIIVNPDTSSDLVWQDAIDW